MKLCSDCKFFIHNVSDWHEQKYQVKYATCSRTSLVSIENGRECYLERSLPHLIAIVFNECGKKARYFDPK